MNRFLIIGLMIIVFIAPGQRLDSLITDSVSGKRVMVYERGGQYLCYPKPNPFGFITYAPRAFRDIAKDSFRKKSLPAWGLIIGSTVALVAFDQQLLDGVQNFSSRINLDRTRIYHDVLGFNVGSQEITIYEAPGNINTFVYQMGEGLPSLLIGLGLATYGHIKYDYRARSTASQIAQTFVTMGLSTQLMKRLSGRESPFVASAKGGAWKPFVNWRTYQKRVSSYDAFPSGHMATLTASLVVLSDNYPEKRWIKPVGYSVMGLVGLAMMNNGVHWAGDYPMAIGLGYVVGKVTVNLNRWVKGK